MHFSFHRWLDQGEDDCKIVRQLYARDNSIFFASRYHVYTFPGKLCFMMTGESMTL